MTASRPFEDVHVLWTSEGMRCRGDTVSVTAFAASIEYGRGGMSPCV